MSANRIAVVQEFLQNTTNLKVVQQLATPDVTYVSLNFDNPELKRIMPWTGTHKGPEEIPKVFAGIQAYSEDARFQSYRRDRAGDESRCRFLYVQVERDWP